MARSANWSIAVICLAVASALFGCAAEPVLPVIRAYDAIHSADDDCHKDCIGGRYCKGGNVKQMKSEPIPCSSGESCKISWVHSCALGCNPFPLYATIAEPEMYCAEYPKLPGDPCKSGADCQPVSPPANGLPLDATMTCDLSVTACISSSQPAAEDFGDSCGLPETTFADSAWTSNFGIAAVDKCSAKLCLIAFRRAISKLAGSKDLLVQRCTKTCKSGWDCPEGTRCARVSNLALEGKKGGLSGGGADVCVPAGGQSSFRSPYKPLGF